MADTPHRSSRWSRRAQPGSVGDWRCRRRISRGFVWRSRREKRESSLLPRSRLPRRHRNKTGPPRGIDRAPTASMRILLAHDYYRSSAPSGEDAVFRNEQALLVEKGNDVVVFERFNDEIDDSGLGKRVRLALDGAWSRSIYGE